MAVKAAYEVTITDNTDIDSLVTWYYLTTSATKPNAPSTTQTSAAVPSPWTQNEPTFTAGTVTNYLYFCIQTRWKDGSCTWGTVQLSSAYEQSKQAWNKANAAQDTANAAQDAANAAAASADAAAITRSDSDKRSIVTEDAAELPLITIDAYGESVQDGTPTPDAPVPIMCVRGRNLAMQSDGEFTKTKTSDSSVSVTSQFPIADHGKSFCVSGAKITMSFEAKVSSGTHPMRPYIVDASSVNMHPSCDVCNVTTEWQRFTRVLTLNASGSTYCKVIANTETGSSGITYNVRNVQMEIGTVASSYVPYGHIAAISVGKNLVDSSSITTVDVNGIAWTRNADGSVSASGTASANSQYRISVPSYVHGNLLFSGCPSGGSASKYDIYAWDTTTGARCKKHDGTTSSSSDFGSGSEVQIVEGHASLLVLRVMSGQTVDITFHPQLEYGTSATEYEPYRERVSYIDLKGHELHGLDSTYRDTLSVDASGHAAITKRTEKATITSDTAWQSFAQRTNTARVSLKPFGSRYAVLGDGCRVPLATHLTRSGNVYLQDVPGFFCNLSASVGTMHCSVTGTYADGAALRDALVGMHVVYPLRESEWYTVDLGYVTLPKTSDDGTVHVDAEVQPIIDASWWTKAGETAGKAHGDSNGAITEAQQAADAAQQAADAAQSSIDNLEIGGRNLALGTGTVASYSDQYESIYKMSSAINGLSPTDEITVSFDVRSTVAQWVVLYFRNAQDGGSAYNNSGNYYESFQIASANTWVHHARTAPAGSNVASFRWLSSKSTTNSTPSTSGSTQGTVEFRNLKVEKGNKATSWTPAPEDLALATDSVEYILGTQTAKTGSWTGVTRDSTLYTGKTIAYKLPYAGDGNASLQLKDSAGNNVGGNIAVYLNTTRVTTHFGAGAVINMTYDGTYWRASSIPNTNNIDRTQHSNTCNATATNYKTIDGVNYGIIASSVIGYISDGYKTLAAGDSIDLARPILWATGNVEVSKTFTNAYEIYPSCTLRNNVASWSGTTYAMAYLKGTVSGNTFTLDSSTPITSTIPTSEDGKTYIPLGQLYSSYQIAFRTSKELYCYKDGAFGPASIREAAEAAKVAGNYIVETASNDVWIHSEGHGPNSSGVATSDTYGWRIGSVFELVRAGASYMKMWVENSIAKLRLGLESAGHAIFSPSGMDVYTDSTTKVASLGESIVLGDTSGESSYASLDYHSFEIADKEGDVFFHVSDLRDSDGNFTETFECDGTTTQYELKVVPQTVVSVKVNGSNVPYTPPATSTSATLTLNSAPSNGSILEVVYKPYNNAELKAFTYGSRADGGDIGCLSYAEGQEVIARGKASHAEGYKNEAASLGAHAEGQNTKAYSPSSHSEGVSTIAGSTDYRYYGPHAEGVHTSAQGDGSHAEGHYSEALLDGSHAEGNYTTACGYYAHSEGTRTTADGRASHAEGGFTAANGEYSHSAGYYTLASGDYQTVVGKFNTEDTNDSYAFIVGNGSAENARSNAATIDWSGNASFAGDVSIGASKTANTVLAAPNGSAGAPSFRSLVAADLPSVLPKTPTSADLPSTTATSNIYPIVLGDAFANSGKISYMNPAPFRNMLGLGNTTGALPQANGGTGRAQTTADRTYWCGRILYDNNTGTNGTVTLAETAANFAFMFIGFRSDSSQYTGLFVRSPNSKKVTLACVEAASNYNYVKTRQVSISAKSISGTTASHTGLSGSAAATTSANEIYITHVIGFS